MKYVQAFITNISFPLTLEELYNYGRKFDIEHILGVISEKELDEEILCQTEGWTVPRWAKTDDIVFFFHAKTADAKISRLVTMLNEEKEYYYDNDYWYLMNSLNRAKAIWREYGGKIFAIGRISGSTYRLKIEEIRHSRSTTFAPIDSIFVLDKPIDISEFNEEIMVSRQSPITPVFGDSFDYLKSLIVKNNKYIWDYFLDSVSQPVPLSKINNSNWLSIVNPYRRSFIAEAQFRAYYVNYLLPLLGDKKTFYKECRCQKRGCSNTWVDNVIHFNKQYLPVEVKLNINLERDLPAQCDQYMFVDEVNLSKDITVDGSELLPYVLIIDTDNVYIYDGRKIKQIYNLDDLTSLENIPELKEAIQQAVLQR